MNANPRPDPDETARRLGAIAAEAGRFLASVADRGGGRRLKEDGSPTTAADLESERLILARLREAWPAIPVVAEESAGSTACAELFFLVDPLDGTRDYLTGSGEYSVNIALVAGARPIAAAIAVPEAGRVWTAGTAATVGRISAEGVEDWVPASVRRAPEDGLVALVSRRHGDAATEACLSALQVAERRVASSAYKFCLVASGEADLYVRCGATMEWDTAAGDHIATMAGATVTGPAGPLTYGHAERGYRNGPFAVLGDAALAPRLKLPETCP
ncbi:3'(2'),5'-bisphosphate nucleotidase CysQ family protein [Enterovirga aerilata]|nr:3'(2'),5'-bisphosphate nucleotidase CysQ [Enterovirga sp. DB1703]